MQGQGTRWPITYVAKWAADWTNQCHKKNSIKGPHPLDIILREMVPPKPAGTRRHRRTTMAAAKAQNLMHAYTGSLGCHSSRHWEVCTEPGFEPRQTPCQPVVTTTPPWVPLWNQCHRLALAVANLYAIHTGAFRTIGKDYVVLLASSHIHHICHSLDIY